MNSLNFSFVDSELFNFNDKFFEVSKNDNNYPLYNIIKLNDDSDNYKISIALPGYSIKDIELTLTPENSNPSDDKSEIEIIKVEEPKAEKPKAEEAKAEKPKVEEAKAEKPKTAKKQSATKKKTTKKTTTKKNKEEASDDTNL